MLATYASFKNDLKIVGYYLLGNFILDVIGQLLGWWHMGSIPYQGIDFIIYSFRAACFLLGAGWLVHGCAGSVSHKSLQKIGLFSSIFFCIFLLLQYPHLHGEEMLRLWYLFYLIMALLGTFSIIWRISKHLNLNAAIMLMLSLGCIAEIFIIKFLHLYWLISVCNLLFYLAILVFCGSAPRYIHLLKQSPDELKRKDAAI